MVRLTFLFLIICIGISSCQKMEDVPLERGYEYQPLKEGLSWVYQVNETLYFGENDIESDSYFIKDLIYHSYKNEAGTTVYLLQRQTSSNRTNWQNSLTYMLRINDNFLLRSIENEIIIPLKFPVKDQDTWDGNLFNVNSEDLYKNEFVLKHSVGQLNFNNVIKVNQEEEDDLITLRDNRYEIYAKGVGLVESYYEVLNYCSRNDCLGEQRIESGRLTHIKLLSYE